MRLEISLHERDSTLWKKLKAYWEGRLADARRQIEADLNEIETAKRRGRIAELKHMLDLERAPAQQPTDAEAAVDEQKWS